MGYKQYCKDYQNIENYEKALADNFVGWECHHRLETHTPDGKRRGEDISHKELKALGLYYNRPANELIFLTTREHYIYRKGRHRPAETRRKMAESRKGKYTGEKNPMYGKHHTDEARRKMAGMKKGEKNPMYGKHHSAGTKEKMSKKLSGENSPAYGKHWYNNGKENKFCYECPDGFVPGRLLI